MGGLRANLDKDPSFKRVSLADAKPGDVVSLNVNPDGSQKLTLSSMNYPIMSIHQYRG